MIRPVGDKVLIRKDKVDSSNEYTTKSGIVVVNSEDTRPKGRVSLGTIEALGTSYINQLGSRVDLSEEFSVGDRVLYYHAAEIPYEDNLVFIRAIDIDCKVEGEISLR